MVMAGAPIEKEGQGIRDGNGRCYEPVDFSTRWLCK